ncbi:unnamed protein product [Ceutorhynchus assimilis]|uniref:Histone-lysine N-methyltransferase, H3 lysine-79 specific n=1 Tax=Ceutorhynchus assimilis TaxID=467358 RepID=A0A9N9MDE0_9CUCU|nr:unnamed protein product [Ceutorhynchus assimilis]
MPIMELRLNSPVGGSPAIYNWPLCKKKGYDEANEVIETIIWGCKDIPDLEVPLKKNILKDVNKNDYESMKAMTKRYNKAINNILSLEKGTQKFCDRLNQLADKPLLQHILQQTYSFAVTNAGKLNKYEAFSPEVYGETSFELVAQMIEHINLNKNDSFIDLGSGVGQVVLQVAATSMCHTCIGIERADVPANYAKEMERTFKFWMQWYGKKYGPFQLLKGDFFADCHRHKFSDANVIFVNNFAFGPDFDHELKQRFAELKHGTKIISSKSFCALNFRISDRNLCDIGTIMNISEIQPNTSSVSWTDKPVSYYLQVIDRTKLENYFNIKKNGPLPLSIEDQEKSCDSFATNDSSDSSTNIIPPPKKRKRRMKQDQNKKPIAEIPKRRYKRKPKEVDNSTNVSLLRQTLQKGAKGSNSPQPSLTCLMDDFKQQFEAMVTEMSNPMFKVEIKRQIQEELIKREYLKQQIADVNQEICNASKNLDFIIHAATAK